jgi:hypothetical protein
MPSVNFWSIVQFPVPALREHIFYCYQSVFPCIKIQHSESGESSDCGFDLNQLMQYLILRHYATIRKVAGSRLEEVNF